MWTSEISEGISFRDLCAIEAMNALIIGRKDNVSVFAREAFEVADAMEAERIKRNGEKIENRQD